MQPKVAKAIKDALEANSDQIADANAEAVARASIVAEEVRQGSTFQAGRFVIALAIFLVIVGAAIVTDGLELG
jgi:hypothetical protein